MSKPSYGPVRSIISFNWHPSKKFIIAFASKCASSSISQTFNENARPTVHRSTNVPVVMYFRNPFDRLMSGYMGFLNQNKNSKAAPPDFAMLSLNHYIRFARNHYNNHWSQITTDDEFRFITHVVKFERLREIGVVKKENPSPENKPIWDTQSIRLVADHWVFDIQTYLNALPTFEHKP